MNGCTKYARRPSITIAANLKSATVLATDISAAAVVVAKQNIEKLQLTDRVTVELGDLYEPLSRVVDAQPFDLIVSNPPYIPSAEIEKLDRSVKDYEPRTALDGGTDGMEFHRLILQVTQDRLRAGGQLFMEIMFDQGPRAVELAQTFTFLDHIRIIKDHAGHARVLAARRIG